MYTVKDFKAAGVTPYLDNTQSPKRYFLIATQLPFFVGVAIKHEEELGLDKEKLKALKALLPKYKPSVVDNATTVKKMEQEAIEKLVEQKYRAEDVNELFVKIAEVQLLMQQAHAQCVNDVQNILDDSQYSKLVDILKQGVEPETDF